MGATLRWLIALVALAAAPVPAQAAAPGALDTTYGSGGVLVHPFGANASRAEAVHQYPDGRTLVAGAVDGHVLLARFNPDGSVDKTFGFNGFRQHAFGDASEALRVAVEGPRIVVAGRVTSGATTSLLLARFKDADGTADTAFGPGGRAAIPAIPVERVGGVLTSASGEAWVLFDHYSTGVLTELLKVTAGGLPDPAFSGDGRVTSEAGERALGLLRLPSGIVAAGTSGIPGEETAGFGLERFVPATGVSAGLRRHVVFGTNGPGFGSTATAVGTQTDTTGAKVLIAGRFRPQETGDDVLAVMRLDAEFIHDLSFGDDGDSVTTWAIPDVPFAVGGTGLDQVAVASRRGTGLGVRFATSDATAVVDDRAVAVGNGGNFTGAGIGSASDERLIAGGTAADGGRQKVGLVRFGGPNEPPEPSLYLVEGKAAPGQAGRTFDARFSKDPDGGSLTYAFESAGFGFFDEQFGTSPEHVTTAPSSPGPWNVGVRVTDAGGATATRFVEVVVGLPAASTGQPALSSASTAELSGTVDPNGLPTQVSFRVTPIGGGDAFDTPAQTIDSEQTVTTTVELEPTRNYEIRARAVNQAGEVLAGPRTLATRGIPAVVPGSVAQVRSTTSSITLGFTVDTAGDDTTVVAKGDLPGSIAVPAAAEPVYVEMTFDGLAVARRYTYDLTPKSQYGTGKPVYGLVETREPDAPWDVTLDPDVDSTGIGGRLFARRGAGADPSLVVSVRAPDGAVVHTQTIAFPSGHKDMVRFFFKEGLQPATDYVVTVEGKSDLGSSQFTFPLRTLEPGRTRLEALAVGPRTATLRYAAGSPGVYAVRFRLDGAEAGRREFDAFQTTVELPLENLTPGRSYTVTTVLELFDSERPGPSTTFTTAPDGALGEQDSDGDGLPDGWETTHLAAMGADPRHKDLFVELDQMEGHAIGEDVLGLVRDAFRRAPVGNPDGSTGINLHVDAGPGSVMDGRTGRTWGKLSRSDVLAHRDMVGRTVGSANDWSQIEAIKQAHFGPARRTSFRYALSVHEGFGGGILGIARGLPGQDFLVTFGKRKGGADVHIGTPLQQATTFMHELGHTLGLRHGGGDHQNHKLAYPSIMNYTYAYGGLRTKGMSEAAYAAGRGALDFSRYGPPVLPGLSSSLTESVGIPATGAAVGFPYLIECPSGKPRWATYGAAADVNCDGDVGDVLPGFGASFDDWANLSFRGSAIGGLLEVPGPDRTQEQEPRIDDLVERAQRLAGDTAPPRVTVRAPRSVRLRGRSRAARVKVRIRVQDDTSVGAVTLADGRSPGVAVRLRGGQATVTLRLRRGRHRLAVTAADTVGNITPRPARATVVVRR